MRRGLVAFLAVALVGVGLVGCGRHAFESREPWRAQAEEACLQAKLVQPSAYMSRVSEIDGPGACGITYPFGATALAGGSVGLTNRLTLACPVISEIDLWLNGTVQPAAEIYFGTTVTEMRAGAYSCRSRNNQRGAKYSEHAFGNALDVFSFTLADGRRITVEKGWRGDTAEQEFLREVFVGACSYFTTVLGPGADVFHYNHFHLDLARHGARGDRRVCRPAIKFEPRLDPERAAERLRPRPRPAIRPAHEPEAPLEIEDDEEDPFAVSGASSSRRTVATSRPAPIAAAPRSAPISSYAASPPLPAPVRAEPRPAGAGREPPSRPAAPRTTSPAGAPLVLQPHLPLGAGIY